MMSKRPTSKKIRMESTGDKQATAAEEDESDEYFVSVDPDSPVVIDSFDSADESLSPHNCSSPYHDSGTDGCLKQTVDSSKSSSPHCPSTDTTDREHVETVNAVECDAEIVDAVECDDIEIVTVGLSDGDACSTPVTQLFVTVDSENCDGSEQNDEHNPDSKCVDTGDVLQEDITGADETVIVDNNHSVNSGPNDGSVPSVVMSDNSSGVPCGVGVECVDMNSADCVKDSASRADCIEPLNPCVAVETAALSEQQQPELQSTTSTSVRLSEPASGSPSKASSSTADVGVKKTAKKTLNQLHEQLLKKAAGVRVESNVESTLHSEVNQVESTGNASVEVELAESVNDKSAETQLSTDCSGAVDTSSMDCSLNTVVVEQCGSTEEQLTEVERSQCDVTESEKTSCELAEMDKLRCERTKSRKAAKPVKRGQDTALEVEEELVAINTTPRRLAVKCRLCTYTCCSNKQLETHLTESHQPNIHPTTRTFVCRLCKYACTKKEVFERHMAHHTGQHTVRYYTCSHCQLTATDMSVVEEHLSSCHTDQSFRFEVLQETILFMQQLLECLVCGQLYRWRTDFTEHCRQSHGLQSLADYLELNYAAPSLAGNINVPRNLFQNLIPDDLMSVDASNVGIVDIDEEEDGCNDVEVWHSNSSSNSIMGNTTTTTTTRHEKRVVGTTLRFYCGSCNYSTENMDLFQSHSRSHTANSPVSLNGTPTSTEKSFSALPIVITSEVSPAPSLNALASRSGSRNILRCHLCPFECSKMVHFRRHCEIHERGETLKEGFRCGYCHFAHNRLNCVKFHLGKYHGDRPIKMSRITDGIEMELSDSDLYALRSRRGHSDSASRSSASQVAPSTVVVQSDSDKYPALTRYESLLSSDRNIPTVVLDRPPSVTRSIVSMEGDKSRCEEDDGESLDSFENQLPPSMIYQEPMKCPKCDFTNRVRVNLIRHLKLHRDEPNDGGTELMTEDCEQFDAGLLKDLETIDTDTNNSQSDDQPLLRRMLTESSQGRVKGNEAISDEPVLIPIDDEILKAIQSTPQDYREFCTKLPHEDLFQCHYCNFTNRFPSKVKRHFHYRHAQRPPYRCGHCTFEAVERGKVAKHCNAVHRSLPLLVVEQENLAEGLKPTAAATAACNSSNNGSVLAELLTTDNRRKTPSNTSLKMETLDIDSDAPSLDYYPKSENTVSAADEPELQTSLLTGNDKSRLSTSLTSVHSDRSGVSTRSQLSLLTVKTEQLEESETLMDMSGRSSSGSRMCRRQFRCGYCGVVSKWNRRDICLHVMHVHIQRRVFTCRHCNFGNSKNKSIVRAHCAKFHPQRVVSVRDDSALLNAVMQVEDKDGIVTVAFVPNGKPILEVDELKEYLSKYKFPNATGTTDATNSAASTAAKTMPSLSRCSSDKNASQSPRSSAAQHIGSGNSKSELMNKSADLLAGRNHWKCRQCSYVHERVGRVRYHVICQHLKLKPFSCPHCHLYLWKPQAVISHIDKCHPGGSRSAVSTVDEKSTYLRRNVVHVAPVATPVKNVQLRDDQRSNVGVALRSESQLKADESDESTTDVEPDAASNYNATNQTTTTTGQPSTTNRPSIFRCNLCGFQDSRNDKTKYHVVKQHLKLRQFSCPYCHVYLWGRQQVAKHVVDTHPDMEVRVQRTFQEYEHFLRSNITKIEKTSDAAKSTPIGPLSPGGCVSGDQLNGYHRSTTLVARLPCDLCTFVTDSELSLSAHRRSHRLYQCSHCDYRHNLVAKVQSHCLSSHPTLPMEYKQWTPSPATPLTAGRKSGSDSDIADRLSVDFVKFYPCDWCPAHFSTQAGLDVHVIGTHDGAYSCRHCNLVVNNKDDLDTHVYDEHPGLAVDYDIVPQPESSVAHTSGSQLGKRPSESADEDETSSKIARPTLSVYNSEGTVLTYKCQLCPYECHKLTVMRHHVMSHLHYHPYTCPYCTLIRSVKSFPIKKHIRLKHPDREENFIYIQNDVLEKKVQSSFCRVPPVTTTGRQGAPLGSQEDVECEEEEDVEVIDEDSLERSPPSLSCEVEQPVNTASLNVNMSTSLDEFGQHKVLYRCNLCGLKTHIRMDMRHHIMREIQYKPFKCMYCPYTEPCRWSMRKHFRTKHSGLEVAVIDNRDPAQDDHVERLLEQCSIPLKEVREQEMLSLKVSPAKCTPSKQLSHVDRLDTYVRYSPASNNNLSVLSPRAGGKLPQLSPLSSVALRLHRCPHCSYSNSNLKLLRGHLVKHGPCRLQCAYCDHRGHYPSRIHKHIRRHHKGLPFKIIKISADESPPALIAEDESSFQANKQLKSPQNVVLLDGVALDIPVEPDDDGAFRCQECGYQSTNREHFKMHVVIHRPPKWQCYYCDQKYPLIFRLRRHSNAKHGNLPIKWIDLMTGQICSDQQKHSPSAAGVSDSSLPAVLLSSFSSPQRQQQQQQLSGSLVVKPRPTARKSTTGRNMMQVALFRSKMFSNLKRANGSVTAPTTTVDSPAADDDSVAAAAAADDSDVLLSTGDEASDSDDEFIEVNTDDDVTSLQTNILKFCCHICTFSVDALSPSALTEHLQSDHSERSNVPPVEVLECDAGDVDVTALRRCGFCSYESYVGRDFEEHVMSAHSLSRPLTCGLGCMFASFSRSAVREHFVTVHPDQLFSACQLDKPYTMLPSDELSSTDVDRDGSYFNFNARVQVENIFEMSDDRFDALLARHKKLYASAAGTDHSDTPDNQSWYCGAVALQAAQQIYVVA